MNSCELDNTAMDKIKVLVVDDSAVVRQVLTEIIEQDRQLVLTAAVADPIFAMKRMKMEWPDVIVLDVNMPRMDGIEFLKKIMKESPTPVVMCSTLTTQGSETALKALAAGALEIIAKPKASGREPLLEENRRIVEAIKAAAKARNLERLSVDSTAKPARKPANELLGSRHAVVNSVNVIAIGTSTGGTQALQDILTQLSTNCPPIVVVQHMPETFTAAFAGRLNQICSLEVLEARNRDQLLPGRVLIAPGGKHMKVTRNGTQYFVELDDGEAVNRHKPSVDVLFDSVAKHIGKKAIGIIMTGMGNDGARGLKNMRNNGAYTLAQDEKTCVVYGMPKEAVELNAVDRQVGLDDIPGEIMKYCMKQSA